MDISISISITTINRLSFMVMNSLIENIEYKKYLDLNYPFIPLFKKITGSYIVMSNFMYRKNMEHKKNQSGGWDPSKE